MPYRPATQLREEIGKYLVTPKPHSDFICVPVGQMKNWEVLAKRIDARFRLDGSKLSKRKKVKK